MSLEKKSLYFAWVINCWCNFSCVKVTEPDYIYYCHVSYLCFPALGCSSVGQNIFCLNGKVTVSTYDCSFNKFDQNHTVCNVYIFDKRGSQCEIFKKIVFRLKVKWLLIFITFCNISHLDVMKCWQPNLLPRESSTETMLDIFLAKKINTPPYLIVCFIFYFL